MSVCMYVCVCRSVCNDASCIPLGSRSLTRSASTASILDLRRRSFSITAGRGGTTSLVSGTERPPSRPGAAVAASPAGTAAADAGQAGGRSTPDTNRPWRGLSIPDDRTGPAPNAVHDPGTAVGLVRPGRTQGDAPVHATGTSSSAPPTAVVGVGHRSWWTFCLGADRGFIRRRSVGTASKRCRDAVQHVHRVSSVNPGGPGNGAVSSPAPPPSAAATATAAARRRPGGPPPAISSGGPARPRGRGTRSAAVDRGVQSGAAGNAVSANGTAARPRTRLRTELRRRRPGVAATRQQHVDPRRPAERSFHHEHHQSTRGNVRISFYAMTLLCALRGCKNRPAPFPGWMSYKATKPGLVSVLYLSML